MAVNVADAMLSFEAVSSIQSLALDARRFFVGILEGCEGGILDETPVISIFY